MPASLCDLGRHFTRHLGLNFMVLAAVGMAAVNHQPTAEPSRFEFLNHRFHLARGIIRPAGPAPENQVTVLVSPRGHDCRHPLLRHRKEMVGMGA